MLHRFLHRRSLAPTRVRTSDRRTSDRRSRPIGLPVVVSAAALWLLHAAHASNGGSWPWA